MKIGYTKSLTLLVATILLVGVVWMLTHTDAARAQAPRLDYMNLHGEKIAAEQLHGKVYLVNFWATSCATCVKEMPKMVETYEKFHGRGFELIAVAMASDQPNFVVNFAETRQLQFQVVLDLDGSMAQAFGGILGTPTTFLINKKGQILKKYVGEPSFEELASLIEHELS